MLLRILAAAAFTLAAAFTFPTGAAQAQALQLVTADEASCPPPPPRPAPAPSRAARASARHARERLRHIPPEGRVCPHGGTKIDPASVKVEYLRGSGVDLTARLKASIKPEGIESPRRRRRRASTLPGLSARHRGPRGKTSSS